jgi:hypothetical protein
MPNYTISDTWDQNGLQPFQYPEIARTTAVRFANSVTIRKGQAVAFNTSTNRVDAFNSAGSNGLNLLLGFNKFDLVTDANGKHYFGSGITAAATNYSPAWSSAPVYNQGWFAIADVSSGATLTAQVDTFTPATIEVGDIFTLTYTDKALNTTAVSFTATATTAANVSAGIIAAWNANATLAAVATASGTNTVVLTSTVPGDTFSVASTTTDGGGTDDQTFTRAATTAAAGRSTANIITGRPGAWVSKGVAIVLP